MFRKFTLTAAAALALIAGQATAAELETEITDYDFSFEGPFGSYDQMQLQRGLQVYTEICAACHGLQYVAFRNLHDEGGPGLPEDQMRAYAEFYEVFDQSLFDGKSPRWFPRSLWDRDQPVCEWHGRRRVYRVLDDRLP
jgi:ubiquinol-cytochrome c reductase cytochrome c1 subunit